MKIRPWITVVLILTALAPVRSPVSAQGSAGQPVPGPSTPALSTPAASFRVERPITVPGDGPHRLPVDVALLTGGTPFRVERRAAAQGAPGDEPTAVAVGGLRDLRLYDASGREVPYLLVTPPAADPAWRPASESLAIANVDTDSVRTSGIEVDLGGVISIDRIRLTNLPVPLMKRARLEGSGDRTRWTVLVNEGTVFDLPDVGLKQIELGFPAGGFRYLRLTWDDRQSARLATAPTVFVREVASGAAAGPLLTAAVTFERRPGEPRQSHFRVRLPAAHLPIVALHLDIAGARVLRDVDVLESRLAGVEAEPSAIGHATLKRVEQGGLAAAALRVPVQPPAEAEIDLVVADGDNPPLDLRGVAVEFAELPAIYLEAPAGTLTARYGSEVLDAPRYDLEAARPSIVITQVADARWGEPRPRSERENSSTTPAPPLPSLGAAVDGAAFRYARAVPAGDAGLIAIPVDAAALAHSAGVFQRFGDVRVLTVDQRQIPYLLERVTQPLSLDLRVQPVAERPAALGRARTGESVYRVDLPFANLPSPRLVFGTSARVFRRAVRVVAERPPDRAHRDAWVEELAQQSWTHANQDLEAGDVLLPLAQTPAASLLVIVEDGDNTPLPLTRARVLLPSYRLRLFREAGQPLTLVYGRADLGVPTYDLGLLASRVLGAAATEVTPGEEQDRHPETSSTQPTAFPFSPRLFWGILALAVLVLLALVVRLIRQPGR